MTSPLTACLFGLALRLRLGPARLDVGVGVGRRDPPTGGRASAASPRRAASFIRGARHRGDVPGFRASDGASLAFDEVPGAGVPVVLVHGVLDEPALWDGVVGRLAAAGRRVLVAHARGHGTSEPWRPGMDWSPVAEASDLAALLRAAAEGGAHLVGHSRGGTAASWVAVEEPLLVKSLTLVASPPQASEAFRARFRERLARARDGREREALAYLATIPDEDFPAYALRRWRGRALVVEAGRDPLYGPTSTLFWRAFLPYADFERLDSAGHDVPREVPEWLADRILRFVVDVEGA